MIADSLEELHAMADKLGLKREWFQAQSKTPHYDICQSKRRLAVKFGAHDVSRDEFVDVMRRMKKETNRA